MISFILLGGIPTPLNNMTNRQLGLYDYDIPNWMESQKIPWFQTTNQYMIFIYSISIMEGMDPWILDIDGRFPGDFEGFH